MVESGWKVKLDPEAITTELNGNEAVVLHLGTRMYFTLNETGLRIWQMLSNGCTIGETSEGLHAEFAVSREEARQSVVNFVEALVAEKLAKVVVD